MIGIVISFKVDEFFSMIRKLLISCIIFIVLLEMGLRFAGIIVVSGTRKNTSGEYTILALGESTTDPFISSWTIQLEHMLRLRFPDRDIRIINEARGGTTTAFIASRLSGQLEHYKPDMVITMMGVNDGESYLVYQPDQMIFLIRFFFEDLRVIKFVRTLIRYYLTGSGYARQEYAYVYPEATPSSTLTPVLEKEKELRREGKLADAISIYDSLRGDTVYDQSTVLLQLGYLRMNNGDILGAKTAFEESIALSEMNPHPYIGLGILHRNEGHIDEAISMLKKAISLDQLTEPSAYLTLATLYERKNNIPEAITMYEKGLERNNNQDHVLGALSTLYKKTGMSDGDIQRRLRAHATGMPDLEVDTTMTFSEITRYHYRFIHDILSRNHIKHVAMQYPTLTIAELRDVLSYDSEVLYVSNEENFKRALDEKPYETFFSDRFGITWGHATDEGNALIARQAADVIGEYLEDLWD